MAFWIRTNDKVALANEHIIVYKIMIKTSKKKIVTDEYGKIEFTINKPQLKEKRLVRQALVRRVVNLPDNQTFTYQQVRSATQKVTSYHIESGIESYLKIEDLKEMLDHYKMLGAGKTFPQYKKIAVFKCIIPQGSKYYYGSVKGQTQITSSNLIVREEVEM